MADKAPERAVTDAFETKVKGRTAFCAMGKFAVLEKSYVAAGPFANVAVVEPSVVIVGHGSTFSVL